MNSAREDGERKFAVLLFADLSGYTELCRRLDPEDVVATVRPVMSALRELTQQHGGVICSVAGDGFFAVFGVPHADPDAGTNAVVAAESMRRLVVERNADPSALPFPDVHVGIAAGEVLVVPSAELPGFNLIGPAINLAARLCDAAPAGVIYVDEVCRTLASTTGEWHGPDLLELRGLGEPVPAYRVGGDAAAQPARPAAGLSPATFVGRAGLLGALDAELAEVVRNAASKVVLLAGEPGVGKTRLVEHWLDKTSGLSSRWVRCAPTGVGLIDLVRQLDAGADFGIAASGAPTREDPFPAALAATRALLADATGTGPLVVVLDDLHAADASLRALVDDIRRDAVPAPLLVVGCSRSGEAVDPELAADHTVGGLTQIEATTLLTDTLGAPPAAEFGQALYARTSGHPLMMLLTAASLADSDALHDGPDGVRPRNPNALAALPTTVRLSVAARLDRLPPAVKQLLQELSTCGAVFGTSQALGLTGPAAEPAVRIATDHGLLVRGVDGSLRFGHDLVREVAYSSLPRGVRARLHRTQLSLPEVTNDVHQRAYHAVAWLEHLGLDHDAERGEAVAAAFGALHEHAAVLFTTQAQSAYDAIKRVMPMIDQHAELAPTDAVRLRTLAATALVEIWEFDEAERLAASARELAARCTVADDAALDAALVHGVALARLRRQHAARQTLDEVVRVADATGDRVRRGRALNALALTWRHESYPTMVALQEEAFGTLRDAGATAETAEIARMLAYITGVAPARVHDRWLALARKLTPADDVRGQAAIARTVALASIYRLEPRAAEEAATRAVELGSRVAAYDVVGDGLSVLVDCAVAAGDHEEFVAKLTEYGELARRTGNPRTDLFTATTSALGLLRMGRLAENIAACELARSASAEFGSGEQAEVDHVCALVARDRGDFATALEHLARARVTLADGYFAIEDLLHRVHEARLSVAAGAAVSLAALEGLHKECVEAGALRLASYTGAVLELAKLLAGEVVSLAPPADGAMLEEQAMRADNAVLRARMVGDDVETVAKQAVALWSALGVTVWLAAAEQRAGDEAGAAETLDAIGAGEPARAWVSRA